MARRRGKTLGKKKKKKSRVRVSGYGRRLLLSEVTTLPQFFSSVPGPSILALNPHGNSLK